MVRWFLCLTLLAASAASPPAEGSESPSLPENAAPDPVLESSPAFEQPASPTRSAGWEAPQINRPVGALPVERPSAFFGGPIDERTKLTGDWWGTRDTLFDNGVTLDVSATQFYQGVASGGFEQAFGYAGRNDYLLQWEAAKAGLWQGLFLNLHGETRYGTDINNDSGTVLAPPNIATLFPLPTGAPTALTAVKFSQYLNDELVVYAGKFNMLDELYQPFGAGRGVDAFMNTGLVFPVVLDRTVPYSTLGAGFSILNGKRPLFTLMVFDTNNAPTTSGFEEFFTNGATTLSKLDLPVFPFGLPGHQGVEGTYSTGTYSSLETIRA